MAAIIKVISGLLQPASEILDELHTSEEEKQKLRVEMQKVHNEVLTRVLEYEHSLLKSKTDIIKAEAQGQSILQRNWRPITMLTFLALVVCDSFGILANPLAKEAWQLLQIGLGGYVVGRSAEKIVQKFKEQV